MTVEILHYAADYREIRLPAREPIRVSRIIGAVVVTGLPSSLYAHEVEAIYREMELMSSPTGRGSER